MTPPTVRITRREDLLGYVPYALGFHPTDSIVLLGQSKKRLVFSARADAGTPTRDIITMFSQTLSRARRISGTFLIAYGPEVIDGPTRTVAEGLRARGYHVREVLRVDQGRYRCLQCDGCTPVDGAEFDMTTSAAAAAATFAGLVARPDRESVERMVKPIGGLAAVAMSQAVDRAEQRLGGLRSNADLVEAGKRAVDEAMRRAEAGERLDDDAVAWLTVLLVDVAVRDHAWLLTDGRDWQLEFWLDLTRRAEPILAASVLTLLAWCAWRQGDGGALTIAALHRALRIDPDYGLARLLTDAVYHGIPPKLAAAGSPQCLD